MEAARRQRLEDLAAVASTLEGERMLADLLISMGLGSQISEAGIACHNRATALMGMIAEARPQTALNILGLVYGILRP